MTNRLIALIGALFLSTVITVAQAGRTIQVDVTYTGSGKVDASHKIYVALWSSADFNSGPPVEVQSLVSKTGTVTFSNVPAGPAYISTAFDPSGKWDAQSPPPSGSSMGMYGKPPVAQAINVEAGKVAKVKVTFDDSQKAP